MIKETYLATLVRTQDQSEMICFEFTGPGRSQPGLTPNGPHSNVLILFSSVRVTMDTQSEASTIPREAAELRLLHIMHDSPEICAQSPGACSVRPLE